MDKPVLHPFSRLHAEFSFCFFLNRKINTSEHTTDFSLDPLSSYSSARPLVASFPTAGAAVVFFLWPRPGPAALPIDFFFFSASRTHVSAYPPLPAEDLFAIFFTTFHLPRPF